MAPKRNQAKSQRGSLLTRGREQLRQRQQTRQQSSRQLPPQGGTTAGSPKARGQRVATAVGQRVNQDVATIRALADNMRRNQARADRQIPADKSPSVRRVGPGGANPKPQGQLPPGQRGGEMRQKGGPLAQRQSSAMTERSREVSRGNTVSQVKVQDLGNRTQAQIRGQRDLPGGTGGADRVTGSGTRTGQPGPNRNALPAGQRGSGGGGGSPVRQPSARPQTSSPSLRSRVSGVVNGLKSASMAGTAYSLAQAGRDELLRRAGMSDSQVNKLSTVDRAISSGGASLAGDIRSALSSAPGNGKRFKNASTGGARTKADLVGKSTPKPAAKPARVADYKDAQGNTYDGNSGRLKQAAPARQSSQTSASATRSSSSLSSPARSTSGGGSGTSSARTRSTQPVSSTTSQAPTERRVSAATANRESGNYGTSRSNNKLLDGYLRDRMRQREGASASANSIGPVKDGNTYAGNLNQPTGRGPVSNANEYGNMLKIDKMKEDRKKKK